MTVALFVILLNWTIHQYLPVLRRDAFFGVRVGAGFRDTHEGQRLLQQYRLLNLALALASGAVLRYAWERGEGWVGWGMTVTALVHSAVMFAMQWWGRMRVLPFASGGGERDVSFVPDSSGDGGVVSGWTWALVALPLLILLGAGAVLQMQWTEIPVRFAVHWGLNGEADRFAEKSFRSVYGTLILGFSTLLMSYAPMLAAIFGTRRGGGELAVLRSFIYSMMGIQCGVALLLAVIGLQPLLSSPENPPLPLPLLLGLPILVVGMATMAMWRSGNREELSDPTPEECWYAGRYYCNPDDAALMVRNRLGVGYSPNFGNRTVQIALPLLLGQFGLTMYWFSR
jgi:uncharacterized membrane protein